MHAHMTTHMALARQESQCDYDDISVLLDADDAGNGQDELQLTPGLALRVKGDLKTKIILKSRPKTRFNHNVWTRNG